MRSGACSCSRGAQRGKQTWAGSFRWRCSWGRSRSSTRDSEDCRPCTPVCRGSTRRDQVGDLRVAWAHAWALRARVGALRASRRVDSHTPVDSHMPVDSEAASRAWGTARAAASNHTKLLGMISTLGSMVDVVLSKNIFKGRERHEGGLD